MKISIKAPKPRNPLVAPARFRRAGKHQPGGGASRQTGARTLRRELDRLSCEPQSP